MQSQINQEYWSLVDKTDTCWNWKGNVISTGSHYGLHQLGKGKKELAHRMMYAHVHGDIPDGYLIRHSCDNPRCVRPDHLILGTHSSNHQDKSKRGRCRNQYSVGAVRTIGFRGPRVPDPIRRDIWNLYRNEGLTQQEIASRFNLSQGVVSVICRTFCRELPVLHRNRTPEERVAVIASFCEVAR